MKCCFNAPIFLRYYLSYLSFTNKPAIPSITSGLFAPISLMNPAPSPPVFTSLQTLRRLLKSVVLATSITLLLLTWTKLVIFTFALWISECCTDIFVNPGMYGYKGRDRSGKWNIKLSSLILCCKYWETRAISHRVFITGDFLNNPASKIYGTAVLLVFLVQL